MIGECEGGVVTCASDGEGVEGFIVRNGNRSERGWDSVFRFT